VRALEIAVFLIILQASIGFTTSLDLFSTSLDVQNNEFSDWGGDTDFQSESADSSATLLSSLQLFWNAMNSIIQILTAVFVVFPILVSTFGIPGEVAAIMQLSIWTIYVIGLIEFKAGRQLW